MEKSTAKMVAKTKPIPRKDKICVWTFPEGSEPAVRVQVEEGKIRADDLLKVVGDALEINERNLQFFGLFRGIETPTRKYGSNEIIYLPCRDVISIQRWSFDIKKEQRYLKTDAGAMRLLSSQCIEEVNSGKLKPKREQLALMEEYNNPAFPCHKQYVELCQTMPSYGFVFLSDCTIHNNLVEKGIRLPEGQTVDLIASRRGLMLKTGKVMFFAPWRKIRRWTQAQGDSIHFEIYFTDELRFEWIEVETKQVSFLMSAIAEFVYLMKMETHDAHETTSLCKPLEKTKLTWKLIKNELFSREKKEGSQDEEKPLEGFDNLEEEESTDEESPRDVEEGATATPSRVGSGYVAS